MDNTATQKVNGRDGSISIRNGDVDMTNADAEYDENVHHKVNCHSFSLMNPLIASSSCI